MSQKEETPLKRFMRMEEAHKENPHDGFERREEFLKLSMEERRQYLKIKSGEFRANEQTQFRNHQPHPDEQHIVLGHAAPPADFVSEMAHHFRAEEIAAAELKKALPTSTGRHEKAPAELDIRPAKNVTLTRQPNRSWVASTSFSMGDFKGHNR